MLSNKGRIFPFAEVTEEKMDDVPVTVPGILQCVRKDAGERRNESMPVGLIVGEKLKSLPG